MAYIERSALVLHSCEAMFDLVQDVKSYPEFLPMCTAAHVESASETEMVAGMTIKKSAISQTFTTRNTMLRPHSINMELVDGPFKKLNGVFKFEALSSDACKVILELNFEVAGKILSMTLNPVFKQAANMIVDAFVKRADDIYSE